MWCQRHLERKTKSNMMGACRSGFSCETEKRSRVPNLVLCGSRSLSRNWKECALLVVTQSYWTVIRHSPARKEKAEWKLRPSWCNSFLPNYLEIFLFKILNIQASVLIQLVCVEFKILLTSWGVFLEDKSLRIFVPKLWPPGILLQYINHNVVRVQALGSSLNTYLLF